jgi:hypothetical protein
MSSLPSQAHGAASRAADSTWLERLTRGGIVGYGVIHLLFAWLIVQIAFGGSSADGDQSGALHALAEQPFGTLLIAVIVVGLIAMTIWQAFEATIGHRTEQGRHRVYERIASAGRAVFYFYFAWTGIKVLRGKMIYGVTKKFEKHLKTGQMTAQVREIGRRLGVAGYAAKGVAYAIAGGLLVTAALQYDPDKARGLDAALRTLAQQSYGRWLLVLTAVGIAAYGLFCLVQARYRKV